MLHSFSKTLNSLLFFHPNVFCIQWCGGHRLVSDDELGGGTMSCCPTEAPSKDAGFFLGGLYQ